MKKASQCGGCGAFFVAPGRRRRFSFFRGWATHASFLRQGDAGCFFCFHGLAAHTSLFCACAALGAFPFSWAGSPYPRFLRLRGAADKSGRQPMVFSPSCQSPLFPLRPLRGRYYGGREGQKRYNSASTVRHSLSPHAGARDGFRLYARVPARAGGVSAK